MQPTELGAAFNYSGEPWPIKLTRESYALLTQAVLTPHLRLANVRPLDYSRDHADPIRRECLARVSRRHFPKKYVGRLAVSR